MYAIKKEENKAEILSYIGFGLQTYIMNLEIRKYRSDAETGYHKSQISMT